MKYKSWIIIISVLSISCNNSKEKELKLREKELELKEKELDYKISQLNTPVLETEVKEKDELQDKKKSYDPSLSNINNLLGNWASTENENIYMSFDRNGNFEFQDLNFSNKRYEKLYGKYSLNNGKLSLMYNDRAQQIFNFIKEGNNISTYYIKKGNYLLVKQK